MQSSHRSSSGSFLSSGGSGYRAPSPRKPGIKQIVQHVQQCQDEIARNTIILQQAALEQERLETYYEQLAAGVQTLLKVMEEPGEGTVLTSAWVGRRDEAIKVVDRILGEAIRNELELREKQ